MLEAQQWVGNGRYQLVRFLRAGGAGVVWEARDRRPRPGESAAVAIKVLDAAAGDGLAFMVMELAVGSLADLVAREGPLPPPIALGCALQACEALAAAHRAGVVHRDVKPHNLLVFADGSVRLADFGAARALMDGHTRTRTGALLGSIPFMAPEQRRDARAVQPATQLAQGRIGTKTNTAKSYASNRSRARRARLSGSRHPATPQAPIEPAPTFVPAPKPR